jgi:general secretion pathway protein E
MAEAAAIRHDSGQPDFETRLLAALEAAGALNAENAGRARRAHARTAGSLIDILVALGLCEERVLARHTASLLALPLFQPDSLPSQPIGGPQLNLAFLRDARVLPVAETDETVILASADPSNAFAAKALALALAKPVSFVVATPSEIEDGLHRLYGQVSARAPETDGLTASDVTDTDVARLRESAAEAPIVRFVERLIAKAVEAGASDIHLEPMERRLRVRLRVDGMLADEEPAALSAALAIVSRIKILARLDIAERRLPQDGSIKMNVRGREVDLRIATIPSVHGESVVIRILDRDAVRLDLEALGFGPHLIASLKRILDRPHGILLVTGPTGSGKSTTLYAALNRLNAAERKIVTVEDPIEYKIDGLNQVQVKPDIGLDFARSLRSILRHDPDVVMVGEIRDGETARIAMQAALTGHLVLSTLHTNDAASAAPRLLDMGIEPYLVASTVNAVLAQRLVRALCADCRRPCAPNAELARAAKRLSIDGSGMVYDPQGCPSCRGTGYRGRVAIAELLAMSQAVRQGVVEHSDAARLRALAAGEGMETLYENGLRAVFAGVTSHADVLRVAQAEDLAP